MKQTFFAQNMGSSDISRQVGGKQTNVACTLLARDYKGLGNYRSNIVVEVSLITEEEFKKWKKNTQIQDI